MQSKTKTLQKIYQHFQKRLQDIRKKQRADILALRKKEEMEKIKKIQKSIN